MTIITLAFDFDDFWDNKDNDESASNSLFEYFLNIFQTPIKDLLNDQDNAVLAAKFRQNAYEFALAKTATFAERSKNSTKEEAQMILAKMFFHNGTEKVQFAMSIQAALEWQEILNDADVFPNLRYQAVGDENTRDSHRALSGIIKPITDAFWDKFYPPIDYRCRCTVRQEKADVKITKDLPKDLPKIPKGLGHNPGKTGQAFNNEHIYFEKVDKKALKSVADYAGYGKEFKKQGFNAEKGTYTVSHKKHGENEIKENLEVAKFLNNEGINVVLLPNFDEDEMLKIIPKNQYKKGKFADAFLPDMNIVMDFKRNKTPTYNAIDLAIKKGKDQANYILLDIKSEIELKELKSVLKNRLFNAVTIKEVWVILKGKLFKLKRADILEQDFPF